ncbi:potassium-transporting ATPase subunit KdpA [Rudanella paleaurantiibacter]|uniref:Potassium-transporting ATPase potassium-binding subunit n=1 Tax=Rudanella paleaurantiibacter TaxID=2614655 RepID=A0A7J5TW08_9BACT|nr:potassium-transporting ATPase subunit KdpA [Rudanella paleaurantiibacter]KAB7727322.1 potassium-transporting ATPase subunit KdpA [Rudanella paleaurantiibacter]
MNTELIGVAVTYLATLLLAIPLAQLMAACFRDKPEPNSRPAMGFMAPLERLIYRIAGIDPDRPMNWKENLVALLTINALWFVYAFFMLLFQDKLPLNPDGNPAMTPDLAFNTAISFMVNCDLQHYAGETGLTYLTQLGVINFLMFVSAATGIAALMLMVRAFRPERTELSGNFYVYFTRAITRILLPGSLILAFFLTLNGVPASFDGEGQFASIEGDTVHVSRGPAAAVIAIKHLGTNGGGYFGANSAHPLENPTYGTNMVELMAQVLLPIALLLAFGYLINRRRFIWVVFGVMTTGFLLLVIPTLMTEYSGSPALANLGLAQPTGAMEGKEVRFGPLSSAYWSIATTAISTGSVNSMHDSSMPLSGAFQLLGMMTNAFYGGCGVGFLNYFYYLIIAVFIAGLMVGRTPELFGRKVEAREIKIASLVALLSTLLIKGGTALAAWLVVQHPEVVGPLVSVHDASNASHADHYHGFTQMLYEFTSANANNGSGFEGLNDNTLFWNVATGFVLLLGRFIPIIGPLTVAGLLANKKYVPATSGTLPTDTATFGLMTLAVILIITALSFFPVLVLGPLAEYFTPR